MTVAFDDSTRAGAKPAEIFALLIGNVQSKVWEKISELKAHYNNELLKPQRERSELEEHHRETLSKLKDEHSDEVFQL